MSYLRGLLITAVAVVLVVLLVTVVQLSAITMFQRSIDTSASWLQSLGYTVLGAGVSLDGDILPSTNNTYDVGSSSYQWAEIWGNNLNVAGTATINQGNFTAANATTLYSDTGTIATLGSTTLTATTANITSALYAPTVGASLTSTISQSITANNFTWVAFDSEYFDSSTFHDNSAIDYLDFDVLDYSDNVTLYNGSTTGRGVRIDTMEGADIYLVGFVLNKIGSPTGNISYKLYRSSDNTVLITFGTIDAATLTSTPTWYRMSGTWSNPTTQSVKLVVEYSGGDINNTVNVHYASPNNYESRAIVTNYNGTWVDASSAIYAFKLFINNNSKLWIKQSGTYSLIAQSFLGQYTTATRVVTRIRMFPEDRTIAVQEGRPLIGATWWEGMNAPTIQQFTDGSHWIQMSVFHNDAATQTLLALPDYSPKLSAVRLGN